MDISLSRHNTFHAFRKFLTKASFLIASELKEEGLQELIKELNKVAVELQGGGEVNLNICKVGDLLKCLERKGHKDLLDVLGPEVRERSDQVIRTRSLAPPPHNPNPPLSSGGDLRRIRLRDQDSQEAQPFPHLGQVFLLPPVPP